MQWNQTYRLVCTPCRRTIEVSAQVDPQALILAHVPRRHILPLDTCSTPGEGITLVRELAKRVLAARECDRQVCCRRAGRLANAGVELGAFGIDQLDQLSVYDLVLAGCGSI